MARLFSTFIVVAILPQAFLQAKEDHNNSPLQASLTDLRTITPQCADKVAIKEDATGAITINFTNIVVRQFDKPPFVKCRFNGQLHVPKGYKLDERIAVTGEVRGMIGTEGDSIAGKLRISVNGNSSSSFLGTDRTVESLPEPQEQRIKLETNIPSIGSCESKISQQLNIYFEALINYRLNTHSTLYAQMHAITINPLNLTKINCWGTDEEN